MRGGRGRGAFAAVGQEEMTSVLIPKGQKPSARNLHRQLKVILGLDIVLWVVLYLASFKFNFKRFQSEEVKGFSLEKSLFDIVILQLLKYCLTSISFIRFGVFGYAWWMCFWTIILTITKFLVFNTWNDTTRTMLLVTALFASSVELWYVRSLLQPVPPEDSSESEMEAQKKKQLNLRQLAWILKPYFWPAGGMARVRVASTWFFLGLSKLCNIYAPLMLGSATNQITSGQIPYGVIATYAALGLGNTVFKELQNVVYLTVKQTAYAQISELTFRHLHSLSLEWHLKKKMGNILRSMDRGVSSADTVVSWLFLYLVPSIAECVVVFVIFFTHFGEPQMSAMALLALVMYIVITFVLTEWRKKFRVETNKHDNDLHDKATDSLINYETVKYFANEEYEIARYCESVRAFQKYDVSSQISVSVLNSSQRFVIQAALFGTLLVAATRAARGQMNLGDFVAINVYVLQLFQPLSFLGSIYAMVIQAFVDMQNLSELLVLEPEVVDVKNAPLLALDNPAQGVRLEFRDVFFRYPTAPDAAGLKGVSFVVPRGRTVAVVGSTGAGKTTIARLLFRFYDPQNGQVLLDGQNIAQVQQKSLRKMVGVVPQDTVLFNDTILHNIKYGNVNATMEEVEAACKAAQIYDFIVGLPKKWEEFVGERGLKLSGGEKQRVAIARCLLKNPPLVLLDEATSALDSVTEKEIQTALTKLGEGRTTLVIAHRLSTIKNADLILVLHAGQVAERGTHEELLAIGDRYKRMWHIQLREAEDAKKEPNNNDHLTSHPSSTLNLPSNLASNPNPNPSPSLGPDNMNAASSSSSFSSSSSSSSSSSTSTSIHPVSATLAAALGSPHDNDDEDKGGPSTTQNDDTEEKDDQ